MTMPHLSNCGHSETHWCLDCVKELGEENISMIEQRDSLAKAIRNAAVDVGIIKPETRLNGPQLLQLCKDLGDQAKKYSHS
jgi:hypothetical protein